MKLTTNDHLAPKLRINGAVTLLPYTPPWCGQGHFTGFHSYIIICYTNVKGFICVWLSTPFCFPNFVSFHTPKARPVFFILHPAFHVACTTPHLDIFLLIKYKQKTGESVILFPSFENTRFNTTAT